MVVSYSSVNIHKTLPVHSLLEMGRRHYPFYILLSSNLLSIKQYEVSMYSHRHFDSNNMRYHKHKLFQSSLHSINYSIRNHTLSCKHIICMDESASVSNSPNSFGKDPVEEDNNHIDTDRFKNFLSEIDKSVDPSVSNISDFSDDFSDDSSLMGVLD